MAKQTKFDDPATEKKISLTLASIEKGLPTKAACELAGIAYSTWRYWLEQADNGHEKYQNLAIRAREADGQRLSFYWTAIMDSVLEGDSKAAQWALEKLYPKDFGNRVELESNVQHELSFDDLSDEELEAKLKRVEELVSKSAEG